MVDERWFLRFETLLSEYSESLFAMHDDPIDPVTRERLVAASIAIYKHARINNQQVVGYEARND